MPGAIRTIRVFDHATPDGVELIFFEIGATVYILRPGGMTHTTFIDCLRFMIDSAFQQSHADLLVTGTFLQQLLPYLDDRTAKVVTTWEGEAATGQGHLVFFRNELPQERPEVYEFIGRPVFRASKRKQQRP